jgi:hypothetical protein
MYQVRFILFYVLGARVINMSQNPQVLIQNLTGLILHPYGALGTWETISIAGCPPEIQISGEFYLVRGHIQGGKGGDGLGVTNCCPDTLFGKDYSSSGGEGLVFSSDRKVHTRPDA